MILHKIAAICLVLMVSGCAFIPPGYQCDRGGVFFGALCNEGDL